MPESLSTYFASHNHTSPRPWPAFAQRPPVAAEVAQTAARIVTCGCGAVVVLGQMERVADCSACRADGILNKQRKVTT